jgi:hypothetical protein
MILIRLRRPFKKEGALSDRWSCACHIMWPTWPLGLASGIIMQGLLHWSGITMQVVLYYSGMILRGFPQVEPLGPLEAPVVPKPT